MLSPMLLYVYYLCSCLCVDNVMLVVCCIEAPRKTFNIIHADCSVFAVMAAALSCLWGRFHSLVHEFRDKISQNDSVTHLTLSGSPGDISINGMHTTPSTRYILLYRQYLMQNRTTLLRFTATTTNMKNAMHPRPKPLQIYVSLIVGMYSCIFSPTIFVIWVLLARAASIHRKQISEHSAPAYINHVPRLGRDSPVPILGSVYRCVLDEHLMTDSKLGMSTTYTFICFIMRATVAISRLDVHTMKRSCRVLHSVFNTRVPL